MLLQKFFKDLLKEKLVLFTLLFFLFSGLFQIFFMLPTSLNKGLGYDGSWYYHNASNPWFTTDSYHIFRQFPSLMAFSLQKIMKMFHIDKFILVFPIRAFQLFNLVCIFISVYYANKLSQHFKIEGMLKIAFFILLLGNFNLQREGYYNPVMTDTCSFAQIVGLAYYFLSSRYGPAFWILALTTLFTNPLPLLLFPFIPCLKEISLQQKPNNLLAYLLSTILSGGFLFILWRDIIHDQRTTVYFYPDSINMDLAWPTFIITVSLYAYFVFNISKGINIYELPKQLNKIKWKYILGIAVAWVLILAIGKTQEPFELFRYRATTVFSLFISLKPLIGLIDSINYFGITIVLLLLNFRKVVVEMFKEMGLGIFPVFAVGLIFMLKSESRHHMFIMPFLSLGIIWALGPQILNSKPLRALILLTTIFLSKIWYPLHWAKFPIPTDFSNPDQYKFMYQQYPAQHYFAFLGPCMGWGAYFIWLPVLTIIILISLFVLKSARCSVRQKEYV